jgi:Biotin/lipoate A/B protein ligase family
MDDFSGEAPRFPPLITPHRLRERQDAFAEAVRGAGGTGDAYHGAGSLFYVGRFELIEFALVLEPEEPLRIARKIFFAGMNALADALSVLSPPEKAITFRYPGSLCFDGARVGGGRLGVPEACGEDETPEWLVFGGMVRAGGVRDLGTGLGPEITTLDDEGFDAWNPPEFAASFARNFLVGADSWGERGMARIGPEYLTRLEKGERETRRGIDENGDLLIHETGREGAKRVSFVDELRRAEWFDPLLNEPRG